MPAKDAPSPDGRRRRSQTSRERIVAALLELVAEGEITPSADLVAARAQVGLRTVFRHFSVMESLYAEMLTALSRHYEHWLVPFAAEDWRGQLDELIERRLATYETLLPFKRAGDAHRHASPSIQAEHARMADLMRQRLIGVLPPALAGDAMLFEALDLILSFDAWQRLRDEQDLPVDQAKTVLRGLAARLTGITL